MLEVADTPSPPIHVIGVGLAGLGTRLARLIREEGVGLRLPWLMLRVSAGRPPNGSPLISVVRSLMRLAVGVSGRITVSSRGRRPTRICPTTHVGTRVVAQTRASAPRPAMPASRVVRLAFKATEMEGTTLAVRISGPIAPNEPCRRASGVPFTRAPREAVTVGARSITLAPATPFVGVMGTMGFTTAVTPSGQGIMRGTPVSLREVSTVSPRSPW